MPCNTSVYAFKLQELFLSQLNYPTFLSAVVAFLLLFLPPPPLFWFLVF